MPHDPEKVLACREWLVIAASDLRAAMILREAAPPAIDQALYHCQQSAEKALKAFLVWHDKPARKTHNLDELGKQCAEIDGSLEIGLRELAVLTAYGWMYRYPGSSEIEPNIADADDAYRLASNAMRMISARLPADVAP
jgi:HEPN domain-containing protein